MSQKAYMTREGAKQLAAELDRLLCVERPQIVREVSDAAAQGDRSENAEYIYGKKKLREIDRRVRYIQKRLDNAEVVEAGGDQLDTVRFGATVVVEDADGERRTYRLLGPDESDPSTGVISFKSPLGRALMRRRVGDEVIVHRPVGDLELEVVEIRYV